MKPKKGDTVELLRCSSDLDYEFNGETRVVKRVASNGIVLTKPASCGHKFFFLREVKIISKKEVKVKRKYEFSKDGLQVGDIVVGGVDKAKVLEVLENSFARSGWDEFDDGVCWYQFKDAIRLSWTIEQPV